MATMVAVPITEQAELRRLTEFASDTLELAGRKRDAELRELVEKLHTDLLGLRADDE